MKPSKIGQSWVYTTVPTQPTKKSLLRTITVGVDCSRYSAPSIAAFGEISPQGSGRDAARFRRGWEAPSENPRQKREAQD